jgi:hypothetical protein
MPGLTTFTPCCSRGSPRQGCGAFGLISDFTSKNPNVFYKTGIAHALGREVIQITQSLADIPFDLGAIRTIRYLHNNEGLELLKGKIVGRLKYLRTAS